MNDAGTQALVRWQESHAAVVTTWFAGLPRALEPLWQLAQVPGATLAWLNWAGDHTVVRWQESHEALVWMWLAGLPFAVMPLWQLMQLPGATPMWLKRAPEKLSVLWQVSQVCMVWMWLRGIITVDMRLPAAWHDTHWVGVPLKRPAIWQVSQRALRCAPVRGKAVCT